MADGEDDDTRGRDEPLFTLVDVLHREHASMRELLSLMQAEAERRGPPDYALLREILQYCETYPGHYHHPKEDLIYRALCAEAPGVAARLEDLEAEHLVMSFAAAQTLRLVEAAAAGEAAARDRLPQKVDAYLRFYRSHMRREEREFFPAALEILTAEQWLALESQVVNPTDPLFAERAAQRLRDMLSHSHTD